MKGPKITVIGAGSYFFGKPVIHKMATSAIMAGGTLALVDTDPRALGTMMKIARRVFDETRCGVKLVGDVDRRKVMKNSDFIVLTFSRRNAYYRGLDTKIAARHGIRMCSSDTIGPGGIFRALREIPVALAVARDAEKLCPAAWVINFVNPAATIGIALMRYAPGIKSFALCDGNHEPYNTRDWCKRIGIVPRETKVLPPEVLRKLDLAIGGVNHCTWIVRFRYKNKDILPDLRSWAARGAEAEKNNPHKKAKPRYNAHYAVQLFDIYGAYPTAISHTKEYVPFFQGYGKKMNYPEPIKLFEADVRAREMAAAWKITEQYAAGKLSVPEFLDKIGDDHATDIIESMWGGLKKQFFINSANRGAVTNLAKDAFLELRCNLDMRGPRPLPFGEMPRGLLALTQEVLDTHELTALAAVTGDRAILRRAMLTDPICNNIGDVDECLQDFFRLERGGSER
jgi:alpha-galactosidase